ncbi:MAG: adenylate/guanylate cyclase domain-containing protein [Candidatus Cloacimonetes bacterium]|nr:adenylate/guanylate cyclase domain-containing protein [Candidatus Cloacimonadota bacterium]
MISIKGELADLIKQRNQRTPEQWKELDNLIWEKFAMERAILVTDSSQFSLKTRVRGIIHYLGLILRSHDIIFPIIKKHNGDFLKAEADNVLAVFPTVKDALNSAIEMNLKLAEYNEIVPENEDYNICTGIGWGKVLKYEDELFGNETNIAYQLGEDIANKDEILLTPAAYEQIKNTKTYNIKFYKNLTFSGFDLKSYQVNYKV